MPSFTADPASGDNLYWPRWSPDGTRIRYSLYSPKTGFHQIWEVASDGRNLRPLLPRWDAAPHYCCGSWTRDGRYLSSPRRGMGGVIFGPLAKAEDFFELGPGPAAANHCRSPFVLRSLPSPDGWLFVFGVEQRSEVVRYDPATRQPAPWLAGVSATGVSFSKDGAWAAYSSFPDHALWRCKADGSVRSQLPARPLSA